MVDHGQVADAIAMPRFWVAPLCPWQRCWIAPRRSWVPKVPVAMPCHLAMQGLTTWAILSSLTWNILEQYMLHLLYGQFSLVAPLRALIIRNVWLMLVPDIRTHDGSMMGERHAQDLSAGGILFRCRLILYLSRLLLVPSVSGQLSGV